MITDTISEGICPNTTKKEIYVKINKIAEKYIFLSDFTEQLIKNTRGINKSNKECSIINFLINPI
mgnify:FL=1